MTVIDKALAFFGLMTIKRAAHINRETTKLLTRTIASYAQRDFGISPNSEAEKLNERWADECFELMVNCKEYEPILVGDWEL